jgi:hypothetical protein
MDKCCEQEQPSGNKLACAIRMLLLLSCSVVCQVWLVSGAYTLLPHHQHGKIHTGHCCGLHPSGMRHAHGQGHGVASGLDASGAAGPASQRSQVNELNGQTYWGGWSGCIMKCCSVGCRQGQHHHCRGPAPVHSTFTDWYVVHLASTVIKSDYIWVYSIQVFPTLDRIILPG